MKINCIRSVPLLAAALAACFSVSSLLAADAPKVGDKAPMIAGKDQEGKTWNLADHLKKHAVLLYFYPKDDTKGCTIEACGFRDRMSELTKDNVEVVGVSFDNEDSHQKFIAKHNLNFTLLADTDGKIAEAYGARMADKNMARRVSFLIDKDGTIKHVTDTGNAETHLAEMKEAVGKLKKAS
jgi:thioredoxin-dependent peroxiredoxin